MTYGDGSASGIFTFNDDGLPVGFEAQRYRDFDGKYLKETWSVAIKDFCYLNGATIAQSSEVTWKLKEGGFTWLKVDVTAME
jgi:hypothetical protein